MSLNITYYKTRLNFLISLENWAYPKIMPTIRPWFQPCFRANVLYPKKWRVFFTRSVPQKASQLSLSHANSRINRNQSPKSCCYYCWTTWAWYSRAASAHSSRSHWWRSSWPRPAQSHTWTPWSRSRPPPPVAGSRDGLLLLKKNSITKYITNYLYTEYLALSIEVIGLKKPIFNYWLTITHVFFWNSKKNQEKFNLNFCSYLFFLFLLTSNFWTLQLYGSTVFLK